jgi:hypothetical protein
MKLFSGVFLNTLFFISSSLYAQEHPKTEQLEISLKACHMIYTPDKEFGEYEGLQDYRCANGEQNLALAYTMVNKDSSIVIGLALMKATPKRFQALLGPGADFNTNYLRSAKYLADTINHKLIFYKSAYSKQKFNADDAGEYYRSCPTPYKGKYPYKRVVFGFKKDTAQFEIVYFYNKVSEKRIDKVIRNTAGIIKFKPDKLVSN